jgi:hypothetical protein
LEELKKTSMKKSSIDESAQEIVLGRPDIIEVRSLQFNDNPTFSSKENTFDHKKSEPLKEEISSLPNVYVGDVQETEKKVRKRKSFNSDYS